MEKLTIEPGQGEGAFRIEYDLEEKVKCIEIPWTLKNVFTCTCSDIDVFNTKAEELRFIPLEIKEV